MKNIQQTVKDMLLELGVPEHLKGYQYLTEAITVASGAEETLRVKVKGLYRQIAKLYGTTPSFVEKAIRDAVVTTWDRGDREFLRTILGYGDDDKSRPTNSEFIILLADEVKLEMLCENAKD